ncbi:MAG: tRNA (adenosine(37)-N6)-threonylcarbamoyltransferase complex dimerization subunit type 1 TsaB [Chitinophagaceae bacterium]|nr:tRNA (adenosine(37)-N6)-threonylcarbamoyltransferase complex dimerization subunit type 1 TsaB [Chitinophagaceae bacterium]
MDKYLLQIDTALARGSVMLSRGGMPVAVRINSNPMEHASFVQPAILSLFKETGIGISDIGAVAVSNGPGSYTGLRVGLASAKGLCYAWNVPLITISTLRIMAAAIRQNLAETGKHDAPEIFLAPMIDARRMEVFFAVYGNENLNCVIEPSAAVVDEHFMAGFLQKAMVFFTGNGSPKLREVCTFPNARFIELPDTEMFFAQEGFLDANKKCFADLAKSEPFYAKDFYSSTKKIN